MTIRTAIDTKTALGVAIVILFCVAALTRETQAAEQPFGTIAYVKAGRVMVGPPGAAKPLPLALPAGDVAISADGDTIAVAVGTPARTQMEGVSGQVQVVDLTGADPVITTELPSGVVTGMAVAADGRTVAFVRDYEELWTLDVDGRRLGKVADADMLAPDEVGAVVFDPTFSPDGASVVFGLVEDTFYGEDDKLDNLWSVPVGAENASEAHRLTDVAAPVGEQSWSIVRGPVSTPNGVVFTLATDDVWHAAVIDGGALQELGPLPRATVPVAVGSDDILFLSMNMSTQSFNLVTMNIGGTDGTWDTWCESGCTTIARNVSAASAAP